MIPFREEGIPAVLQIEDMENDFNRYYHGGGDTIRHMNIEYFMAQTRALTAVMAHLAGPIDAGGRATPTPIPTPITTAVTPASATPSGTVPAGTLPATRSPTDTPSAAVSPSDTASPTAEPVPQVWTAYLPLVASSALGNR